jgi:hypothetical protein
MRKAAAATHASAVAAATAHPAGMLADMACLNQKENGYFIIFI